MKNNKIKWFKGYRKVKVLRKINNEKVEILFLDGVKNLRAIVRIENLKDKENPQARKERERILKIMKKEQELLERLKSLE
ncbi:hypothetical protein [Heyndrickxia coagulans]|uniref:hypothetical protein n=1 Tax=Heyndrickxia coagulans TaxID=1398 RepID=UPI003D2541D7